VIAGTPLAPPPDSGNAAVEPSSSVSPDARSALKRRRRR
jgi:hypothetical protein